jgi:hypothetical protein
MTDLEHADISRRLALAIGWPEYRIGNDSWGAVFITSGANLPIGKFLDYRDFSVIWPIAEKFNAFPRASLASNGVLWFARVRGPIQRPTFEFSKGETAALTVALAVIKAKEAK